MKTDYFDEFHVNSLNIIQDLRKFEGEHISIPYFYDLILNGCCDDEVLFSDDDLYQFFVIGSEDRDKFPDLTGYGLCLWESDNGFVHSTWYDSEEEYKAELNRLCEEAAESYEGEEE